MFPGSVATSLDAHERVVWGGRRSADVPGALDDLTVGKAALLLTLDRANELVVLDPLSFPWESLRSQDREIPVVAVLPADCDAESLDLTLGDALLAHLGPHDRLVESRPDVRDHLEQRWGLPPVVWTESPGPFERDADAAPEPSATSPSRIDKALQRQVVALLAPSFAADVLAESARASVVGGDPVVAALLSADAGREVTHVPADRLEPPELRDQLCVVLVEQGLSHDDRVARLRAAFDRLSAGGRLVVLATVVPEPGTSADEVATTSLFVEELQDATGTAFASDDLQSVRWLDEPVRRGLLLAGTSLLVEPEAP